MWVICQLSTYVKSITCQENTIAWNQSAIGTLWHSQARRIVNDFTSAYATCTKPITGDLCDACKTHSVATFIAKCYYSISGDMGW